MTLTTAETDPDVENASSSRRIYTGRDGKGHLRQTSNPTTAAAEAAVKDGRTAFERKKQRHASGESTVSTDSVGRYIPTPPDGGYGWIIVMASFFNHVIVDGIAYTFGVFYVEFLEQFKESKSKTSLVGSLLAGCYLFSAPVASALVNKFGCRPVTIAGAIIAFMGFVFCTFSPNVDVLIVTYGIIGGAGLGLFYLPNVIAVSYYFQKRRATATGIALCGAGVGCFLFAPLGEYLLHIYDWKNAMLIVAGITLNGCVFGALLRPLEAPRRPPRRRPRAKNILDRLKEQTTQRIGRQRTESECSTNSVPATERNREVLKRLQQIKWAKETALHEEDSISDFGSVLNSVRRLDALDAETPCSGGSSCVAGIPASRPIPIPVRRTSSGNASSAPAGGLPLLSSIQDIDGDGGDGGSSRASVVACSFTQSPVRTLSPAEVVEQTDELDVDVGGEMYETDGLVAATFKQQIHGNSIDTPNEGKDDVGDLTSPSAATSELNETQSLVQKPSKSRDVSRQTTIDSFTGYGASSHQQQHGYHDGGPVRRNTSTVSFSASNVVIYAPPSPPPAYSANDGTGSGTPGYAISDQSYLDVQSSNYAEVCQLRLPHGVHRQDFARPLYRSDIFYSGSIINIPEYRSQLEVQNYVRSITTIPEAVQPDAECWLWRRLPVSKAIKDTLKRMTDLSLVRDPLFLVPVLANLMASVGLFVPFVFITKRATDLGVHPSNAAWLLSTIGITNTLGRIIAGFFADNKNVNTLLMHNIALISAGLACFANMWCTTYASMHIFAAAFGLCIATWITLTSIVLCDLLGLERLTNAFGLLCMSRGIAAMIGSPVSGAVYDITGNYDSPFHVSGSTLLFGGVMCCLLHLPYFQLRSLTSAPAGKGDDTCHEGEVEGNSLTAGAVASPGTMSSAIAGQPAETTASATGAEGRNLVVSISNKSINNSETNAV